MIFYRGLFPIYIKYRLKFNKENNELVAKW